MLVLLCMKNCIRFSSVKPEKVLSFYHRCVRLLPHPARVGTGGEDAFLSLTSVQAVLDGVSWWKDNTSVDAGMYSSALARAMFSYVEEDLFADNPLSSYHVLQHAYDRCKAEGIEGTSTALVATLQPPHSDEMALLPMENLYKNCILDVCSLGDCTAMVVRRGRIVFINEEQYHDLDFPYQIGNGSNDTPSRALRYRFPVYRGDLVLLGSDGVFDNLYPQRVAELMWPIVNFVDQRHSAFSSSASQMLLRAQFFEDMMRALVKGTEEVMQEARSAARDIRSDTPYAEKAVNGGAYYEGGRQDDMTLLVSVIDEDVETNFAGCSAHEAAVAPYPYKDWP